jgi:hypothetical protein
MPVSVAVYYALLNEYSSISYKSYQPMPMAMSMRGAIHLGLGAMTNQYCIVD